MLDTGTPAPGLVCRCTLWRDGEPCCLLRDPPASAALRPALPAEPLTPINCQCPPHLRPPACKRPYCPRKAE